MKQKIRNPSTAMSYGGKKSEERAHMEVYISLPVSQQSHALIKTHLLKIIS